MGEIVGGTEGKNAEGAGFRQLRRIGGGKHLVDRAIATAGDDAIHVALVGLGNGFGRQARSIGGLPGHSHLDDVTVAAQRKNSRAHPAIDRCLAMENDANAGHVSAMRFRRSLKRRFGFFGAHHDGSRWPTLTHRSIRQSSR